MKAAESGQVLGKHEARMRIHHNALFATPQNSNNTGPPCFSCYTPAIWCPGRSRARNVLTESAMNATCMQDSAKSRLPNTIGSRHTPRHTMHSCKKTRRTASTACKTVQQQLSCKHNKGQALTMRNTFLLYHCRTAGKETTRCNTKMPVLEHNRDLCFYHACVACPAQAACLMPRFQHVVGEASERRPSRLLAAYG